MSSGSSSYCVDVCYGYSVHFLYRFLDLKFIGLTIHDKAVTVQLFALIRQLLCNYWLNNDSHLLSLLAQIPFCKSVLNTVDEHQSVGVHNGVGADLVNRGHVHLLEVAG